MVIEQLDVIDADMNAMESIAVTLEACRIRLESLSESDTLTEEGMRVGLEMASGVAAMVPATVALPSLESFNDEPYKSFSIAMEGLADLGRKVWAAIKNAIKRIIDFFLRLIGRGSKENDEVKKQAKEAEKDTDDNIEAKVKGESLSYPYLVRYWDRGYAKDIGKQFERLAELCRIYLDVLEDDARTRAEQVKELNRAVRTVKSNPRDVNVRKNVKKVLRRLAKHTDEQITRIGEYGKLLGGGEFIGGLYIDTGDKDKGIEKPHVFRRYDDVDKYAKGDLPKLSDREFKSVSESIQSIMAMTAKYKDQTGMKQVKLSTDLVEAMDEFIAAVEKAGGTKQEFAVQLQDARAAATQAIRNSAMLDQHAIRVSKAFLSAYGK